MPRNDEVARLPEHLERLNDAGVDALILADLGAFTLAGKYAPKCERHISTQQSIANYECARAWYDLGAKRVVLAREVSLQEIREMRAKLPPELELETFCHGAMCVSYSGRCLLSNYMTGRDSNRGACAQPCRYQYALMEEKRPGEYFPVFEDEKGTYIMNSRDMCMIDHLDDIMDAGIDCIKIEGRAKSEYYAAIVTGAYRHVLDEVAAGETPDRSGSTRSSTSAIATIRPASTMVSRDSITTIPATSATGRSWRWSRAATRTAWRRSACATSSARATRWRSWGPDCKPFSMVVPEMRDAEGFTLLEPRNPRMIFTMQLPRSVPAMSFVRHAVDLSAKGLKRKMPLSDDSGIFLRNASGALLFLRDQARQDGNAGADEEADDAEEHIRRDLLAQEEKREERCDHRLEEEDERRLLRAGWSSPAPSCGRRSLPPN